MNTLFVYYKLHTDQHDSALTRLQSMARELMHRIPELQVDLMQRPEISTEGIEPWLEVYRHPAGIGAEVMKMIDDAALNAGLPQPRRTEVFVTLK